MPDVSLHLGDCLDILPTLAEASVDCVICDPPYPCIKRSYGVWTEAEWFALMDVVVPECRRILKPSGSAVFILQPNSERVGRMRLWPWEFMVRWGREWGIVQDAWWWNTAAMPGGGEGNRRGLMRPSVKACVWLGPAECYRDREAVLWSPSEVALADRRSSRALRIFPSGVQVRDANMRRQMEKTGGVTPFNVLPIPNTNSTESAGSHGHGAGTPTALADWWLRYICPPGGTVLDPFLGSGTTALAAIKQGKSCVGIERIPEYMDIARSRIAAARAEQPLFSGTA